MRQYLLGCLLFFVAAFFFFTDALAAGIKADEVNYDISVDIDPVSRTLKGQSIISVKKPGELILRLGRRFEVTFAMMNGRALGPGRDNPDLAHVWRIPLAG